MFFTCVFWVSVSWSAAHIAGFARGRLRVDWALVDWALTGAVQRQQTTRVNSARWIFMTFSPGVWPRTLRVGRISVALQQRGWRKHDAGNPIWTARARYTLRTAT